MVLWKSLGLFAVLFQQLLAGGGGGDQSAGCSPRKVSSRYAAAQSGPKVWAKSTGLTKKPCEVDSLFTPSVKNAKE